MTWPPRLVCARCKTPVVWTDHRGTPRPDCPHHPTQQIFLGVGSDDPARVDLGPREQAPPAATPRQGSLFE